jgi:hypothetical protein
MGSKDKRTSSGRSVGADGFRLKGLITVLLVIIIVGGGVYLVGSYTGINFFGSGSINLQSEWQAVFLNNGQVYFGKIVSIDDRVVVLSDIYYLQVINQPLQRSQEGGIQQPASPSDQRLTLIKLGNEIHGPRDEMIINRDHVIIIEDLKNDSRVVQAIDDYVSQRN